MSTSWEYEPMQHSDELYVLSHELVLGDVADTLASQTDALASAHASGDLSMDLSEALDMLDVEAGTSLDNSSLDGVAYSASVKEHNIAAALDLLDAGVAAAVDNVAELLHCM